MAIAGAEVEPAQEVHDPLVDGMDLDLLAGCLAQLLNMPLQFALGFGNDFFDARGVDAAVGDEFVQGNACHFAADGVEGADDHDARRVVDDHIHARGLLERADVPAFAADDPAFHFVVGDVHGAGRGFRGVGGGVAL